VLVGEAVHTPGAGDVGEACGVEGQSINQSLAEDRLLGLGQGREVPDAAAGTRQVQVQWHSLAQALADLAAVDLHHLARAVEDWDGQRPTHQLVAAALDDAQLLQPSPDRLAVPPLALGDVVAQSPVGEAELEAVDDPLWVETAPGQVLHRLGVLLQGLVVVEGHPGPQLAVAGLLGDQGGELLGP